MPDTHIRIEIQRALNNFADGNFSEFILQSSNPDSDNGQAKIDKNPRAIKNLKQPSKNPSCNGEKPCKN